MNFQDEVDKWMLECFGPKISNDKHERNFRFLEESLELVQACDCTASEAHQLVDYVFNRPVGEVYQEVGGVMVTLAALCTANKERMHMGGWIEVDRIKTPSVIETIREKQKSKPKHSPLAEKPTEPPNRVYSDKFPITNRVVVIQPFINPKTGVKESIELAGDSCLIDVYKELYNIT